MLTKRTFPLQALLGCRNLPAESSPDIAGIGGPSYLGRIAGECRVAPSFGASPSANPVSDRKSRCTKELPVNGWKPNMAGGVCPRHRTAGSESDRCGVLT